MFTKTDIENYFLAEKSESILFICIGIAAIIAAIIFFYFIKTNRYKGAAIPFLLIGLIHVISGFTVFNRSDDDRKRNVYAYDMNVSQLKEKELPRMEKVNENFIIYRYIKIASLAAGLIICFIFYKNSSRQFWVGFGIALALEAAITLSADCVAAKRAIVYTESLSSFVNSATPHISHDN
jgi:hypothetical protein